MSFGPHQSKAGKRMRSGNEDELFSLFLQVLMEDWMGDAPGMRASSIICGHFSARQIKDA